jgi:hypothetical protein
MKQWKGIQVGQSLSKETPAPGACWPLWLKGIRDREHLQFFGRFVVALLIAYGECLLTVIVGGATNALRLSAITLLMDSSAKSHRRAKHFKISPEEFARVRLRYRVTTSVAFITQPYVGIRIGLTNEATRIFPLADQLF